MSTDRVMISKDIFLKLCAYHLWDKSDEASMEQICNELQTKLYRVKGHEAYTAYKLSKSEAVQAKNLVEYMRAVSMIQDEE